jgi:fatty-acyl-CoA synthase
VLRPGTPRDEAAIAQLTDEIKASVRERKGPVHSPKHVIVADGLPLTGLGKPDKKALRAKYW